MKINITTGQNYTLSTTIGEDGRLTNATGYNILDNYIYGGIGDGSTSNLIKISSNSTSMIGPLLKVSATLKIGDVDNLGQYWGLSSVYGMTTWVKIDVNPSSST